MPAIVRWSRSSVCSGRGASSSSFSRSRRRVGPRFRAELGERLVLLELPGAQQLDPGGLLGAELAQAQLRRRSRPRRQRLAAAHAAAARCDRAGRRACRRAAAARRTSGGAAAPASSRLPVPSISTIRCLPRRRTPAIVRPSSAASGGSKVFSALMPGASADSIAAPCRAPSSRRAVISTSGSSGMAPS